MRSISTVLIPFGVTILLTAGLVSGCDPDDPYNQNATFMGTADGISFYTSLVNEGISYDNVKVYCAFFGFQPAIIDTPEKDEVIHNFLLYLNSSEVQEAKINTRPFWLTLTDIKNEGTFLWDGSSVPPTYFNWAPGSPQSNNYAENCVSAQLYITSSSSSSPYTYSYGWINLPCGSTCWRPLCQRTRSL